MKRDAVIKTLCIFGCLAAFSFACATGDAERDLAATGNDPASCEKTVNGKRTKTGCPGTARHEGLFMRDAGKGGQ